MKMSQEIKERLLRATKEPAAALAEDTAHIREIMQKNDIKRGDVRRLSNILRRILIDNGGDVSSVAPPRTGRVRFVAPDNGPIYTIHRKTPFEFFGSGAGKDFNVFSGHIRGLGFRKGAHYPAQFQEFEPHKLITLSHDGFLSQDVLCLNSKWINRRSVIKYIANVASGVHSTVATEDTDKQISAIRNCATYSPKDGNLHTHINVDLVMSPSSDFVYSDSVLDPVLLELLCAAHFYVSSPDVKALEEYIKVEFAL